MALNGYNNINNNMNNRAFIHGGFDDFFLQPLWPTPFMRPMGVMHRPDPFEFMPVLPNLLRNEKMHVMKSSPGYEINESETKYQVAVDVPGINPSDLTVNIEQHGSQPVLHVSGSRKFEHKPAEDDKDKTAFVSETKFEKRFTIGSNVDVENMTASLAHGVLVLSAPKKDKNEKQVINIPISTTPATIDT
jgi:HSP20 family protein